MDDIPDKLWMYRYARPTLFRQSWTQWEFQSRTNWMVCRYKLCMQGSRKLSVLCSVKPTILCGLVGRHYGRCGPMAQNSSKRRDRNSTICTLIRLNPKTCTLRGTTPY